MFMRLFAYAGSRKFVSIEEVLGSAAQRCNSKTWGLGALTHMVEAPARERQMVC